MDTVLITDVLYLPQREQVRVIEALNFIVSLWFVPKGMWSYNMKCLCLLLTDMCINLPKSHLLLNKIYF